MRQLVEYSSARECGCPALRNSLQPEQITLELFKTGLFGPEVQLDRRQLVD